MSLPTMQCDFVCTVFSEWKYVPNSHQEHMRFCTLVCPTVQGWEGGLAQLDAEILLGKRFLQHLQW